MMYKTTSGTRRTQKTAHLSLNLIALLAGIVGIVAVFKYHHDLKIPDMYTLHSWFGLSTICLFALQVIHSKLWINFLFLFWLLYIVFIPVFLVNHSYYDTCILRVFWSFRWMRYFSHLYMSIRSHVPPALHMLKILECLNILGNMYLLYASSD